MRYRDHQEVPDDKIFLTDGGLETVLVFEKGIDLPEITALTFFQKEGSEKVFRDYLVPYIELALKKRNGFQLVDCGWRASSGWGEKLGLNDRDLERIIRSSGELMQSYRAEFETEESPMPVVGCIGPRGDGYQVGETMSAEEAIEYHSKQIGILADTRADSITAMTLGYPDEAIGVLTAAKMHQIPAVISFTLETDGRLPDGETLREAIEKCDAATDGYATGFMINCAHPTHFRDTLGGGGEWQGRICGVRANASEKSHEELDNSTELDRGNPSGFGEEVAGLGDFLPSLRILGGCCGTDIDHIESIAKAISARKSAD